MNNLSACAVSSVTKNDVDGNATKNKVEDKQRNGASTHPSLKVPPDIRLRGNLCIDRGMQCYWIGGTYDEKGDAKKTSDLRFKLTLDFDDDEADKADRDDHDDDEADLPRQRFPKDGVYRGWLPLRYFPAKGGRRRRRHKMQPEWIVTFNFTPGVDLRTPQRNRITGDTSVGSHREKNRVFQVDGRGTSPFGTGIFYIRGTATENESGDFSLDLIKRSTRWPVVSQFVVLRSLVEAGRACTEKKNCIDDTTLTSDTTNDYVARTILLDEEELFRHILHFLL